MSEARTDTTEARPREESAQSATSQGKHRGPAASEDAQRKATQGKHRRPA